jgi:hypothetical protein
MKNVKVRKRPLLTFAFSLFVRSFVHSFISCRSRHASPLPVADLFRKKPVSLAVVIR